MKRKIIIATVTAAALVGGGTATAFASVGDDGGATRSAQSRASKRCGVGHDRRRHDDDAGTRPRTTGTATTGGTTADDASGRP